MVLSKAAACAVLSSLTFLAAPVSAQSVFTYARGDGARFELRTFDEQTGQSATALQDVEFLPIELAGQVRKDRLRLNLSRTEAVDGLESRILLPSGAALYRISRSGATELLLVPRQGAPDVLLSVPDSAGSPSLATAVHVAPDESWVAASTADGEVLLAELGGAFAVRLPTAQLGSLAVEPASLRVSSRALWFVADGELYRAGMGASDSATVVAFPVSDPIDPEILLAGEGGAVVAAAVEPGGGMDRRLYLVRATGAPELLSDPGGKRISAAGLEHPLGPFLAVAPDAGVVAWRQVESGDHEVFIRYTQQPGEPIELTDNSTFANYIDSIGVFAFGGPRTLCFFAGDRNVGHFIHDQRVGASDMYAVQLDDPAALEFVNITRTSQQASAPFVTAGDLDFGSATVGPYTRRIHLDLELGDGAFGAGRFEIEGGTPGTTNFEMSPEQLSAPALRFPTSAGILLQESLRESVPLFTMELSKVECSGDPQLEPIVRILVHDKTDPFDPSAKVFFDGHVALGEPFEAHAASAGETHLPGDVKVHVLALDNTPLQFVRLDSDCSEPMRDGDRFGAVRLVDSEAEEEPLNGATDHCLTGSKPVAVTLAFRGGDCAATQHHQDPSKVRCSGSAGSASSMRVLASDNEDPFHGGANVWFDGTVGPGESFELLAAPAGEPRLKSDTWVHVIDGSGAAIHSVRFHTSCSQPLVEGDRYGAFELVAVSLEEPTVPGDLCAYGRPRALTFVYEGRGCAPVALGQRLRLDPSVQRRAPGVRHAAAPQLTLGPAPQGPAAAFTFPLGVELVDVTPNQSGAGIGFVARGPNGLGAVHLLDCWTGAMTKLVESGGIGPCLGFSPSRRLLVPRAVGDSHVLELYSGVGSPLTVDTGPAPILPLLR